MYTHTHTHAHTLTYTHTHTHIMQTHTHVDMLALILTMYTQRMWTCDQKPADDYYSFTNFAHKCNSSAGIRVPLLSDSRCGCGCVGVGVCVWVLVC